MSIKETSIRTQTNVANVTTECGSDSIDDMTKYCTVFWFINKNGMFSATNKQFSE